MPGAISSSRKKTLRHRVKRSGLLTLYTVVMTVPMWYAFSDPPHVFFFNRTHREPSLDLIHGADNRPLTIDAEGVRKTVTIDIRHVIPNIPDFNNANWGPPEPAERIQSWWHKRTLYWYHGGTRSDVVDRLQATADPDPDARVTMRELGGQLIVTGTPADFDIVMARITDFARQQYYRRGVTLVLLVGFTVFITALVLQYVPSLLRWRPVRRVEGTCRACGYDLRATPTRCPECGLTIPAKSLAPSPASGGRGEVSSAARSNDGSFYVAPLPSPHPSADGRGSKRHRRTRKARGHGAPAIHRRGGALSSVVDERLKSPVVFLFPQA